MKDSPNDPVANVGIDIRAVIGALRRRKAIIASTIFVVTSSAALAALLTAPRYTATSTILLGPREARVIDMEAVAQGLSPRLSEGNSVVATQIKLLAAQSRAQQIIERFDLVHDPELNSALRDRSGNTLLPGSWLPQTWLVATGLARPDEGDEGTGSAKEPDADRSEGAVPVSDVGFRGRVIDAFQDRLDVHQEGQSDVVSVSFTSTDPNKAAQIANAVVQSYIEGQLGAKAQATARASEWVARRTEVLRKDVLQAERAVEAYRATNNLIQSLDGRLDTQQLASLNAELIAARAERTAKEVRLRQLREMLEKKEGDRSLTEMASSSLMTGLREREAELLREHAQLAEEYGPRHPRILQVEAEKAELARKMDLEIGSIVRNLNNETVLARGREHALLAALEQAKRESALAGRAAVQLGELEREAAARRSIYSAFLARLKELEGQQDLLKPDAEVISLAAVPDEPSFPNFRIITVVSFATSLMLGPALAAVAEHLDRGLRSSGQIRQVLDMPNFGLVPRIEHLKRAEKPHRYLLENPLSVYSEAIKEVHRALQLTEPDVPPQVVLVTSTVPGEGKTTLAMSLGASLARSGHKTVVVDLDLRHPSIGRELGRPFEAGLIEILKGTQALDQVIREEPREGNLHIIPVAAPQVNPSDLLESIRMRSLLAKLRDKYDYIVLDTPPALGTTDARVAAQLADAVVFVVRWHTTAKSLATNGLQVLLKSRVPVAGVVLTQVDLKRHLKYDYGDVAQYYAKYRKYYKN